MHRRKRGLGERPQIFAMDFAGLVLFVLGFSLPLLLKWLEEFLSNTYVVCIGLSLSTVGIAFFTIRSRGYERSSRKNVLALIFFILLDFFFLYFLTLAFLYPPPKEMRITIAIVENLRSLSNKDPYWLFLRENFERIASLNSFSKPHFWWIHKVLSHGNESCEAMLFSLNELIENNSIKEAEVLINSLYHTFERIDLATSEFSMYYIFLATLALFFSTIIFLSGKTSQIGISHMGISSGLITYSYPLLLSFGLACSLYTTDLYPLFSWVPYSIFMLAIFKKIEYDQATLFGLAILIGGLLGAYTPVHPFSCLWYFCIFCFFMLILLPSVLPNISRDILLAISILAGCAGVNSAISMIFIHTTAISSLALFSVIYDLVSIIFALSEVSSLPRVLGAGMKTVAREGFWPILGFILSVLFLAFGLLSYFNPIPSLLWILSLSLLCYVLIYSMRAYTLKRRRLAKFGEVGDVKGLFLVCVPGFIFVSIFPVLYRQEDPLYLLLASFSFLTSALSFMAWYIRGDRLLRAFLLKGSSFSFVVFAIFMIAGPLLCLLELGFRLYYLSIILPAVGLIAIHKRNKRGRLG